MYDCPRGLIFARAPSARAGPRLRLGWPARDRPASGRRHRPAAPYNHRMIRAATAADTPAICRLIRGLAAYERLAHAVDLEEAQVREHLFGPRPFAEVLLAEQDGAVVGFALFFPTYSTF